MNKIVIGILPTSNLFVGDSYYDDFYKFINLYPKRVFECNAIPIGILMDDGKINYDVLDMCDGFIIPGGNKVNKYVYELLYYALKKNKPVLGICLGAQSMAIFSAILERMDDKREYSIDEVSEIYTNLKSEYEGSLLRTLPKENIHILGDVTRESIDTHRHKINILEDSILYDIYKTDNIDVISLHSYDFKHVGKDFKVTAFAEDGVAEAIEYNNKQYFILGVHFHPEVDGNNILFERLIEESKKRK
jgi:putative glutamine amidotransferase